MIIYGVVGFLFSSKISKLSSLIILVLGAILLLLGLFTNLSPFIVPIIIGICLVIKGIESTVKNN